MHWKIRDLTLDLRKPVLMGVLNVTPDSFSDGGRFLDPAKACDYALQMAAEGASLLDLGAESTRPGAEPVGAPEQIERLLPVIRAIRLRSSIPLSIDTTQTEVARACLEAGASVINDVSGLRDSGQALAECVSEFDAGLVLMHRRGNAQTMQSQTDYADLIQEVLSELEWSAAQAGQAGLRRENIVLDPGIGFAKTAAQSLELMRRVEEFAGLGYPILLGPSRKSFLGVLTGQEAPRDREFATAAAVAYAALKGVALFRVHAVGAMRDVIEVTRALMGETNSVSSL